MLLNDVKENMILARDIVDRYGRTLITAGMPLKQELINLLKNHEIFSISVRDDKTSNYEISKAHDLINMDTRLKLISRSRT